MSPDRCAEIQVRLIEAFLARREPSDAERRHAAECRACGTVKEQLEVLARDLAAEPAPALRAEVAQAIRARATRELAGAPEPVPELPPGFRRELVRILIFAAAPLPLLALWYAWLFEAGGELLSSFLPGVAVAAIGAAFAVGTLSWLAAIYGSIPFVAHHRARRRWREVTS